MIVPKHGFKKRYQYGGSGIFDTMVNVLTSSAAKQKSGGWKRVGKYMRQIKKVRCFRYGCL